MPGLSEAYRDGPAGGNRRRAVGAGLVLAGVAVVVLATVAAGADSLGAPATVPSVEPVVVGALAGAGFAVVLLGGLLALPASDRTLAAGTIGTGLAGLGVGLFVETFPAGWAVDPAGLPVAAGVYALGAGTALACAVVAVDHSRGAAPSSGEVGVSGGEAEPSSADRNADATDGVVVETPSDRDAGAESTRTGPNASDASWAGDWVAATDRAAGSSHAAGDDSSAAGDSTASGGATGSGTQVDSDPPAGSGTPEGSDPPASNDRAGGHPATSSSSPADSDPRAGSPAASGDGPRADADVAGGSRGGRVGASDASDDGVVLSNEAEGTDDPVSADVYCGNCAQFRYVHSDGSIRPYCARNDALMDDMTACEDWRPNR